MGYILAVDQGTTSTRTIIFGADGTPLSVAQEEFRQIYPHPGWIEHDPNDIWQTTLTTMRAALHKAAVPAGDIAAIGITNQRETTLVWSRETGEPICNAIVWQDRRTADLCASLAADGCEEMVTERTGLLLDPYFSATKIGWMLDNVSGARARAEKGELAFGTVDTYLLWRLTNGQVHATDATNASRTLLFNIRSGAWDEELLRLFAVPPSLLPEVRDTAGDFGSAAAEHLGNGTAILAVAGDQQAALVGQACLQPGMVKATYGTGGIHPAQYRADARPLAASSGDDHRLPMARHAALRPGRIDLRRRRGGQMAARRARHHRLVGQRGRTRSAGRS